MSHVRVLVVTIEKNDSQACSKCQEVNFFNIAHLQVVILDNDRSLS